MITLTFNALSDYYDGFLQTCQQEDEDPANEGLWEEVLHSEDYKYEFLDFQGIRSIQEALRKGFLKVLLDDKHEHRAWEVAEAVLETLPAIKKAVQDGFEITGDFLGDGAYGGFLIVAFDPKEVQIS